VDTGVGGLDVSLGLNGIRARLTAVNVIGIHGVTPCVAFSR
jgi:hypothetical protein